MSKGGFHPDSRAQQNLAEIQVGAAVYGHLDQTEDQLVERLLSWLYALFAAMPARLAEVQRWEQSWRAADQRADCSVLELRELAVETSGLLGATA